MSVQGIISGLAGLFVVFALGVGGCGAASTPELCDVACMRWDTCAGPDDWYPYATCITECRAEGDWTQGYVDCLGSHTTCEDLELNCG